MSHTHLVKNGKPGSRQAHHNREKFNPYRHKDVHEQLHSSILDTMTSLCCKRCCDTIQWKVDFGKYHKKLNDRNQVVQPKRCNACGERKLAIAFHHICQECAKAKIVCAKCQRKPKLSAEGKVVEEEGEDEDRDEEEGEEEDDEERLVDKNATRQERDDDDEDERRAHVDSSTDPVSSNKRNNNNHPLSNKAKKDHVLQRYAFVNALDSDDEFHPYQGLDIRRLKQYKRRVEGMQKQERLQGMRERERRSVLRQQAKEKGEGRGGGGDDDDVFSEEEL